MKATYKRLLEQSEHAAIAAIEIYNKPDFKYREESFIILIVNAWELLLKARLLHLNKGKMTSLYVYVGRRIKKSRCGNPFTVELFTAAKKLSLDQTIFDNLEALTEIRDGCIHFHPGDEVKSLVFNLGSAALRNYATLLQQWFTKSLSRYDFFILPLGFNHGFTTFDGDGIAGAPKELGNILKSIQTKQDAERTGDFMFSCEIDLHLRSSKIFSGDAAAVVKVDQTAPNPAVIVQEKRKLDQYPLSYSELVELVKKRCSGIKQGQINSIIKAEVKGNSRLSSYSFLKKQDENRYLNNGTVKEGTTCIYNHDAVEFICQRLAAAEPAT